MGQMTGIIQVILVIFSRLHRLWIPPSLVIFFNKAVTNILLIAPLESITVIRQNAQY